jgi:hypothetical protein
LSHLSGANYPTLPATKPFQVRYVPCGRAGVRERDFIGGLTGKFAGELFHSWVKRLA